MSPPDRPGRDRPGEEPRTPLTGVDRLFGRDLRSKGWVLKAAPVIEPRQADRPESETAPDPDPAMIWALNWRRK